MAMHAKFQAPVTNRLPQAPRVSHYFYLAAHVAIPLAREGRWLYVSSPEPA